MDYIANSYFFDKLVLMSYKTSTLLLKILLFLMTLTLVNGSYTFALDTTPPTTAYTQTPSSPNGSNGWYKSVVNFVLHATDLDSGVKEINYRVDEGTWQKVSFSNTINLLQNPSFETSGATNSGSSNWTASPIDAQATYNRDTATSYTGYETSSAKIITTGGTWHGINNQTYFAPVDPLSSMTATVYTKTLGLSGGSVYFKAYSIGSDNSVQFIANSSSLAVDSDWTQLTLDFTVTQANAVGVYLDLGIAGAGTVWFDAATLTASALSTKTSFNVGSDSDNHKVEFYSIDNANNIEAYSCTAPVKNCITFKLDTTPPGNWHSSGAFRGLGSSHELYVYTNVSDATSGLSIRTDKYQYLTDLNPTFGRFSDISKCNSTWQVNQWVNLMTVAFSNGVKNAYVVTPRTNFCNNDWKTCKTVRFYAEDLAGNSTTKEYCINGPWISLSGKGTVRANHNITMLSEADGYNTDGLIETAGNSIDFFNSSTGQKLRNSNVILGKTYDDFWNSATSSKTQISNNLLRTTSGVFYINGNFNINNSSLPNAYRTSNFSQVVFINGDLTVSVDVDTTNATAALFIVKGDVKVLKAVDQLEIGIFGDKKFYTAYNVTEGEATPTLALRGIYKAEEFVFQRTLQGTNNSNTPSEEFIFEPKFMVQLKPYFGSYNVKWESGQ
jgi:hypothetical protein